MRKAIASALLAVAAMAPAFSTSLARSGISFSSTSPIAEFPSLNLEIEGGLGAPVRCGMMIDTALHSRVSKVSGSLMGNADVFLYTDFCTEGNVGLLVGGRRVTGPRGPFHLTYKSFSGTLPNINSITFTLNNVSFWIELEGINCLTDGAVDIDFTSTGNPMSSWNIVAANIPLTGEFLCIFSSGEVNGHANATFGPLMTLF